MSCLVKFHLIVNLEIEKLAGFKCIAVKNVGGEFSSFFKSPGINFTKRVINSIRKIQMLDIFSLLGGGGGFFVFVFFY